jgi:sugar phosphate isomerase/epimerase
LKYPPADSKSGKVVSKVARPTINTHRKRGARSTMFSSFNARAVGLTHLSAEETVELAAGAGFEGVDLLVRDLVRSGSDPKAIRTRMDDLGLKGGAFPCLIDWRGGEASFRLDLERLGPVLEAASVLGLSTTGTWVMPELPLLMADRAEVAALHVRRLGTLARSLDAHGIRLGLEVIGVESFRTGQSESFVARLGDLDKELGAIWAEAPNLGILLDAFHLHAADEPIEAGLTWGINRICWVHIADLPPDGSVERSKILDANRGLPGDNGAVDVGGFLARLAREGYEGPVTVEPMANCRSLAGLSPRAVADRVKQSLDLVWPRT